MTTHSHYIRPLTEKEIKWTFKKGNISEDRVISMLLKLFGLIGLFCVEVSFYLWNNIYSSAFMEVSFLVVSFFLVTGSIVFVIELVQVALEILIHHYYKKRTDKLLKKNN